MHSIRKESRHEPHIGTIDRVQRIGAGVRRPAGVAMRVTAPSNPRGARTMRMTVAALALLGAGVAWLALKALVMWVTQD